jgi:hypothetical protein
VIASLLLFATLVAAQPMDARHTALLGVLSRDTDYGACNATQLREAVANAAFKHLGQIAGRDVELTSIENPCICGAQNCPYYVVRFDPAGARMLYSTYGIGVKTAPAQPLPTIIVSSHESALVMGEVTAVFRNGRYVDTTVRRVRADTNERKPDSIAVRFAPGASSAVLSGRASLGWYDAYRFDAVGGQQLTVTGVSPKSGVQLTLFGPGDTTTIAVAPEKPVTLRRPGTYTLHVEPDSESETRYALTLAIR